MAKFQLRGEQHWVPGGPWETKSAAREAERRHRERLESGRTQETCASFAGRWLREWPRPAASTRRHYALGGIEPAVARLYDVIADGSGEATRRLIERLRPWLLEPSRAGRVGLASDASGVLVYETSTGAGEVTAARLDRFAADAGAAANVTRTSPCEYSRANIETKGES